MGIDISRKAQKLVLTRLKKHVVQTITEWNKKVISRNDIPETDDSEEKIDLKIKTFLYGEPGGFCKGCGQHFFKENLQIDHKIPKSKGGSDNISNLQLLCGYCNSVKGARPMEYLIKSLKETSEDSKYCSF